MLHGDCLVLACSYIPQWENAGNVENREAYVQSMLKHRLCVTCELGVSGGGQTTFGRSAEILPTGQTHTDLFVF